MKKIFSRENPSSLPVKIFKTVCGNFLKTNGSRDILKNLLIKRERQKNKENSAKRFRKNYLTHHLAKFLHGRIKP